MLAFCSGLLKGQKGGTVWPKALGNRSQVPRDRWGRKLPPQPNTAQFLSALPSQQVQAAKGSWSTMRASGVRGGTGGNSTNIISYDLPLTSVTGCRFSGGTVTILSPTIFPSQVWLGADSSPETPAGESQRGMWAKLACLGVQLLLPALQPWGKDRRYPQAHSVASHCSRTTDSFRFQRPMDFFPE